MKSVMRFVSIILQGSHQICGAFSLLVFVTVIYYNFMSLFCFVNISSKNLSVCSLFLHIKCLTDSCLFVLILFFTPALNLLFVLLYPGCLQEAVIKIITDLKHQRFSLLQN